MPCHRQWVTRNSSRTSLSRNLNDAFSSSSGPLQLTAGFKVWLPAEPTRNDVICIRVQGRPTVSDSPPARTGLIRYGGRRPPGSCHRPAAAVPEQNEWPPFLTPAPATRKANTAPGLRAARCVSTVIQRNSARAQAVSGPRVYCVVTVPRVATSQNVIVTLRLAALRVPQIQV